MVQIIDAKIVKVPKNVYGLVRSFVNSSLSLIYIWSFEVKMGDVVWFIKPGKWILKIYKTEEGLSAELCGYGAKIVYNPDVLLEISLGKEVIFRSRSFEKIVTTYIESDGVFMEPIPLSLLIEKLDHYIDAVNNYVKIITGQEQNKETSIQNNVN